MAKTVKPELSVPEKTAFLASLLPNSVTLHENWKEGWQGKYFNGWSIYRHFDGKWAWFKNFFVVEPMIYLDEGLSPATVFDQSEPELVEDIINRLEKGILEKFGKKMNTFGVPIYATFNRPRF